MVMTNEFKAILHLTTTCGEACWYAREDICKCSCGGKNHGILRTANGVKPQRTKHVHGHEYKLIATGLTYHDAFMMTRNDYGEFLAKFGISKCGDYPNDRLIFNRVTDSQAKWQEIANIPDCVHINSYIVWERTDSPKTW